MGTTFTIYFLCSLYLINCIPMFDYYDQTYDQFQYDEQNNVDSNSSLPESNKTSDAADSHQVQKYSIQYSNGTAKDLYLIRTIIYEIGILTNPDESKNASVASEMQDQIDISLFKPTKDELIDDQMLPKTIKGQVDQLTSSALKLLDVVPLLEIPTKNRSSTEIRQLSVFPHSFVRLTANISTVRSVDDIFAKDESDSKFSQEEAKIIGKNVETRTSDKYEEATHISVY